LLVILMSMSLCGRQQVPSPRVTETNDQNSTEGTLGLCNQRSVRLWSG
jgi:hypothetical protein